MFFFFFFLCFFFFFFFFFQAEDGIRDVAVTGVQTCALPISYRTPPPERPIPRAPPPRRSRSAVGASQSVQMPAGVVRRVAQLLGDARSEERRVGKECRYRWWPDK